MWANMFALNGLRYNIRMDPNPSQEDTLPPKLYPKCIPRSYCFHLMNRCVIRKTITATKDVPYFFTVSPNKFWGSFCLDRMPVGSSTTRTWNMFSRCLQGSRGLNRPICPASVLEYSRFEVHSFAENPKNPEVPKQAGIYYIPIASMYCSIFPYIYHKNQLFM